jgi:hypothetical protein
VQAENIASQDAETDGYILDTGTLYRALAGVRTVLEVEKVTARYAPELALDTGLSFEPTFEAFTMSHVPPAHGEASSSLPSHIDPSVLDLRPPYDR